MDVGCLSGAAVGEFPSDGFFYSPIKAPTPTLKGSQSQRPSSLMDNDLLPG